MKKVFLSSFFFLSFFYILPFNQVNASKIIFEDNFNDQTLDNWSEKRNSQWSNPASKCKFGLQDASWKIEDGKAGIEINGPGCVTELTPDNFSLNGVNNFIYKLDVSFPITTNVDRNYVIKYKDANNWTGIHLINQDVIYQKVVNGTGYFYAFYQGSYNFIPQQIYTFENIISGNSIKLNINNTEVLNFTDQAPFITEGTIGLQASVGAVNNSKVLFDNIEVTDLDAVDLEVPYFSQNDPEWGSLEYDSASQYSWGANNSSIERWGCAMTSGAMILHYYGHDTLPNGTELTPGTLNQWLKDQSDGYFAGNTNWLALTRLTRLNNELNSSKTVLEFTRNPNDDDVLIDELENEHPVILRVPEVNDFHFVVAKGIDQDKFQILDPEWEDRTDLSQYDDSYHSMRIFTPSQTDLSYFMFATSPNINLALKDSNGNSIPMQSYSDEEIADPSNPSNKQPEQRYYVVPKPETDTYKLEISAPSGASYSVQSFIYNEEADVTITKNDGYTSTTPQILNIDFDEQSGGTVKKDSSFEQFIKDVELMKELGHLKSQSTYTRLKSLAQMGISTPNKSLKLVFAQSIETVLKLAPASSINTLGKTYLLSSIKDVQTALKAPTGS